ncbi:hypothetical protein G6F57_021952 [Rhizopus arrhizus]|nr:hypothetical protein G6F57_021952 [Rhizopus arrhizus]
MSARTANPVGTGDFDDAVHRRRQGGIGHGLGYIVRRDRLDEGGGQQHLVALGARLHDAAQKLEELRAVDDGVGDAAFDNQRFLGDLAAEVSAFSQAVRTDDRQRDVVAHASPGFSGQQVAA